MPPVDSAACASSENQENSGRKGNDDQGEKDDDGNDDGKWQTYKGRPPSLPVLRPTLKTDSRRPLRDVRATFASVGIQYLEHWKCSEGAQEAVKH